MNETNDSMEQKTRELALKVVEKCRDELDTSDERNKAIEAEMAEIRAKNEQLKARVQVLMRQKEMAKAYDEQAMTVALKVLEAVPNADEDLITASIRRRFCIEPTAPTKQVPLVQQEGSAKVAPAPAPMHVPRSPNKPAAKGKAKPKAKFGDGRRKYMKVTPEMVLEHLDKEGISMTDLVAAIGYDGGPEGIRPVLQDLIMRGQARKTGLLRSTKYHLA